MDTWIRLMTIMAGRQCQARQKAVMRGLAACALSVPLLLAGCTKTTQTSYRLAAGQKEVPLQLEDDVYRLTFFAMTQPVALRLSSPAGTKFVASNAREYTLPLEPSQRQSVYFDVVDDGTSTGKEPAKNRRIEFHVEGYERPGSAQLPFEERIWSKAPNNKPYTPHLLEVKYRYALSAGQKSMQLNLGEFRHDPKSRFWVQGDAVAPVLVLKSPPGEEFVFSSGVEPLEEHKRIPVDAIRLREYRLDMKPGLEHRLRFWLAGQNGQLHAQTVNVDYSMR